MSSSKTKYSITIDKNDEKQGTYSIFDPNSNNDIKFEVISYKDRLCPSGVTCFWEGDFEVTLLIKNNDQLITLNDHDSRKGVSAVVNINGANYVFQGLSVNNSENVTYFNFTVELTKI